MQLIEFIIICTNRSSENKNDGAYCPSLEILVLRFSFSNHSNQTHKEKTKHEHSHPVYVLDHIIQGDKSRLKSVIKSFTKKHDGFRPTAVQVQAFKKNPNGWVNSTIPRTLGLVDHL